MFAKEEVWLVVPAQISALANLAKVESDDLHRLRESQNFHKPCKLSISTFANFTRALICADTISYAFPYLFFNKSNASLQFSLVSPAITWEALPSKKQCK